MAEKQTMTSKSTESLDDGSRTGSAKGNKEKTKNCAKEGKADANERIREDRIRPGREIKLDQSSTEVVIKEGHLSVSGKGLLKKNKLCFFRLLPSSPSSRARLQQYSKAESAKQKGYHPESVILAHDVISVAPLPEPEHAFVIQYRDENLILIAEDDVEKVTWIKAIQKVLLSEHQVTYNDVKIPRSFEVYISKETQIRIGDDSSVELSVEYGSIAVIAANSIRLVRWPIAKLRSFGFDAKTFMVKAGSTSEHGEGLYTFITNQGEEIHRTVKAAKTKDSSFEGPLPVMGSPPRPYSGPPSHTPYDPIYAEDAIYEPVGSFLQEPSTKRFQGPNAPLTPKVRYPSEPIASRFPMPLSVKQSPPRIRAPSMSVEHTAMAGNGAGQYDNLKSQPRNDHSYCNVVTAFPIHPNQMMALNQPAAEESLYSQPELTKKRNSTKTPAEPLIPPHKLVSVPHDSKGYTLVMNNKL